MAQRGARANAIGISRGGRTTKIRALVDVLGRPLRLVLTPGNTSDVKGADLLINETVGMKRVIADRGYDANRIWPPIPDSPKRPTERTLDWRIQASAPKNADQASMVFCDPDHGRLTC